MIKQNKWRCQICSYDNPDGLTYCEMCQTPKPRQQLKNINKHQYSEIKQAGIICPNKQCNIYNLLTAENCVACQIYLFGDGKIKSENKYKAFSNKKLKYCYSCRFQNDPNNTFCVNCQKSFKQKVFPIKPVGLFGVGISKIKVFCEDCGSEMEQCSIPFAVPGKQHSINDYNCSKCAKKSGPQKKLCIFCDQHLERQVQKYHDDICEKRTSFFRSQKNPIFERCTKRQIQTIYHMHTKYQKIHQQKKHLIYHRIRKLGYSNQDFQNLHHYIINYAPIIIHVSFQRNLTYYVKDTHYRNQFEVRGGCDARVQWQDRMFDNFHHTISGYQRVKYGTMNFTNDPQGVMACGGYGQSYLILKNHVRDRCTITDMDSASPIATIATFRFIFHLLMKLSDQELIAAFQGSKGKEMKSNVIRAYKQIQIHGPVEFSKDIERVYVCKQQIALNHQNLLSMLKQFCLKNKLEYELFDMKQPTHPFHNNKIKVQSAPERIVENQKQKEQSQKTLQQSSHIFKTHLISKTKKKR